MAQDCYNGPVVPGIDVSHHQGRIDWDRVAQSGLADFVYIRASQGPFEDERFAYNWREAGRVGLRRGAYHFFRGKYDGKQQADVFVNQIKRAGGMKSADLPPAFDFECPSYFDGDLSVTRECRGEPIPPTQVMGEAKRCLARMQSKLGRKPVLYTGYAWIKFVGMNPEYRSAFSGYPLWRPHYNTRCVLLPPGFTKWTIHQWSSSGVVEGIATNVDLNVFRGDEAAFASFIRDSKTLSWGWLAAGAAALGAGLWYFSRERGYWRR